MVVVAVFAPSTVVAVIIAVPVAIAVTNPVALTVATAVLLELQVMFLFIALFGAIVGTNCKVPETIIDEEVGLMAIEETGIDATFFTSILSILNSPPIISNRKILLFPPETEY